MPNARRRLLLLIPILAGACASAPSEPPATVRPTATPAPVTAAPVATPTPIPDAFTVIEEAFVGSPSRDEIRPLFDEVLELYEGAAEPSDDLYRRAADTLIGLRTVAVQNGCPERICSEMAILREMLRLRLPGVNFPAAARQAADSLAAGS